MIESNAPTSPKRRSSRGKWTVAAMFFLGGLVLLGLFLAPRPKSPSAPADVPFGVPERPLNFFVYDLGAGGASVTPAALAGEIMGQWTVPDYLILFHVSLEEAAAIAERFGMQGSYDPRLGQTLREPDEGGERITACILSRLPLYDAAPLTKPNGKEPYGVQAWSVVGGRKFVVACALSTPGGARGLAETWKASGSPPMVAGILVDATAGSAPAELTGAGFSQGWGLSAGSSDSVPGRWRPRLTFAGAWQSGAGANWATNNTRAGVWSALGGRTAASRPATDSQVPSTRP